MHQIFEHTYVEKPYVKKNYKDVLLNMEMKG